MPISDYLAQTVCVLWLHGICQWWQHATALVHQEIRLGCQFGDSMATVCPLMLNYNYVSSPIQRIFKMTSPDMTMSFKCLNVITLLSMLGLQLSWPVTQSCLNIQTLSALSRYHATPRSSFPTLVRARNTLVASAALSPSPHQPSSLLISRLASQADECRKAKG